MPDLVAVLRDLQCAATHVVWELLMAPEDPPDVDLHELSMLEFDAFDSARSSVTLRFAQGTDSFGEAIREQAMDALNSGIEAKLTGKRSDLPSRAKVDIRAAVERLRGIRHAVVVTPYVPVAARPAPPPIPLESMPESISLEEIFRGKQRKTLGELIPFGSAADLWESDEEFDEWMKEW